MRKVAFLTMNVILRWPIWGILRCLRRFSLFDYIFLVYPGDSSDLDGYCPRWLARSWLFLRQPTIGGMISGKSLGLVLVVPNTVGEFKSNSETTRVVLERLAAIQKRIGAKSVALAGRLPTVAEHQGVKLAPPFVQGVRGTLFCVMDAIERAAEKHALDPARSRIGILGVGRIGHVLLEETAKLGWNIFGVDVRPDARADVHADRVEVFCGPPAFDALATADVVVVLTTAGSDFYPYLKYLKPSTIVLDDTHPMIRQKPDGIVFYKVAVERKDVFFRPKLPGYKKHWIPGCAVEAIVTANTLDFDMDQQTFNKTARALGLRATLGD